MAVRLMTGSSGNGTNGILQYLDRTDFKGNTETFPLMSASSRLGLNFEQDEIDETRDSGNCEDGGFPAIKLNYDGRVHPRHNSFWAESALPFDKAAAYSTTRREKTRVTEVLL